MRAVGHSLHSRIPCTLEENLKGRLHVAGVLQKDRDHLTWHKSNMYGYHNPPWSCVVGVKQFTHLRKFDQFLCEIKKALEQGPTAQYEQHVWFLIHYVAFYFWQ